MMDGTKWTVLIAAPWIIGAFFNCMVRFDYPQKEDNHTAFGKSILWPLFVIRFVVISLVKACKALVS